MSCFSLSNTNPKTKLSSILRCFCECNTRHTDFEKAVNQCCSACFDLGALKIRVCDAGAQFARRFRPFCCAKAPAFLLHHLNNSAEQSFTRSKELLRGSARFEFAFWFHCNGCQSERICSSTQPYKSGLRFVFRCLYKPRNIEIQQ